LAPAGISGAKEKNFGLVHESHLLAQMCSVRLPNLNRLDERELGSAQPVTVFELGTCEAVVPFMKIGDNLAMGGRHPVRADLMKRKHLPAFLAIVLGMKGVRKHRAIARLVLVGLSGHGERLLKKVVS